MSVLENELDVLHRLLLGPSELLERRQKPVPRVEGLEPHSVRVTTRHEVDRLQDLKRPDLSHGHVPVELVLTLTGVASDAAHKVRSRVHEGSQQIVQSRVKVLS